MQTLDDKFINLDNYGVPIGVNYRGNDTYKTRFGALLSLFSIVLLVAFGIKNGQKLIHRQSPQITVTNEVIDYANDDTAYKLEEQDVTVIFETRVRNVDGSTTYELPEKYGRLTAFQFEIASSETYREPYKHIAYDIPRTKVLPWMACADSP